MALNLTFTYGKAWFYLYVPYTTTYSSLDLLWSIDSLFQLAGLVAGLFISITGRYERPKICQ